MHQGRRRESPPVPLAASLGATSAAGDMSDIRPDILEMIKEEQKVSTQRHVAMLAATCACSYLCTIHSTHAGNTEDIRRALQEGRLCISSLRACQFMKTVLQYYAQRKLTAHCK